jgi:hypothetical protein
VIELGRGCQRHRPALVDFIDRGEVVEPATGLALAHLDRCDRCTAELESTVQAITALRRLGDDIAHLEPAADAWPRLRARLERWRPLRWTVMSPSVGMVMSVALVAVLIAPMRIGGPAPFISPFADQPARPTIVDAVTLTERRVEAEYISSIQQGTLPASEPVAEPAGSYPRNYPDNYRPERKEVSPAEPSGRPPEAI